jgi:hypothetical protein
MMRTTSSPLKRGFNIPKDNVPRRTYFNKGLLDM